MLKLAADENFNYDIIRGLLDRNPDIDLVRIQDVGLAGVDDPSVLSWAAQEERVLLTHDVQTMTHYAYARVKSGQPMPGVFEISRKIPLGIVIDNLVLIVECSLEDEWEGQVRYLPL